MWDCVANLIQSTLCEDEGMMPIVATSTSFNNKLKTISISALTGDLFNTNANTIVAAEVRTSRSLHGSKQLLRLAATMKACNLTILTLPQHEINMTNVVSGKHDDAKSVFYDVDNLI